MHRGHKRRRSLDVAVKEEPYDGNQKPNSGAESSVQLALLGPVCDKMSW